jgi:hypothetical protein
MPGRILMKPGLEVMKHFEFVLHTPTQIFFQKSYSYSNVIHRLEWKFENEHDFCEKFEFEFREQTQKVL